MSESSHIYVVFPAGNQSVIYRSVEEVIQFLECDDPRNWGVETWDGKHSMVQDGKIFLADNKRRELEATIQAVEREHNQRMANLKAQLAALSQ